MGKTDKKGKVKPVNNSSLKESELKKAGEVNEFAENIINTVREHLLILDKDLRVIKASRSFCEFFKIPAEETIGELIYNLANCQWNIPKLRDLLEEILPEKIILNNYKVEHVFSTTGKRIMLLNARQIEIGAEKEKIFLLAIEDITEREKALRESQEKYSKAFRTSSYGITISHAEDGRFIEVNEAFTSITGYTQEEVLSDSSIGLNLWANPEDRKYVVSVLLEGKEVKDIELQFRLRNGDIIDCILSAQIIYLTNEPCIIASISNITERKQIERKLKESEERFRTLYENSTIGLYRTTPCGKIILANPALVKMLGYSSFEELTLRNLEKDDFEPAYNRKQFLEQIERDGEVINLESVWTRTDGVLVYMSESATAIRDSNGNTLYYDGTVEDITERKHAGKALKESENELQVILESTADGILAINDKGKVIKTNKRFAELWHIPSAILDTKDDDIVLNYAIEQLVNPEEFLSKVRFLYGSTDEDKDLLYFKDGRMFERYSMPLIMDDSSVGRVWSFHDISERKQAEELLLKSEEKYRSIFENIQDVYIETLLDGTILEVSPSIKDMSKEQYSRDDLIGKPMYEFYSVAGERKALMEILRQQGNNTEFEMIFKNRDSSIIPCSVFAKVLSDVQGRPEKIVGSIRDISKRKQAEELLKKSEEKYRGIFDNIQDVYFETSIDGTILEVSPSIEIVSKGKSRREDLIGKSMLDFYADTEEREVLFSILKQKGRAADYKVKLKTPDGSLVQCSIFASILFDEKGKPKKVVGSMHDITERKRMEEALIYEQSLLRALLDYSPDLIYFKDIESRFIRMSKSQIERFGSSDPLMAIGKTDFDFFSKEHALQAYKDEQEIIRDGKPLLNYEEKETWPDGHETWVSTTKLPFRNVKGEYIGTFGISRDITERKRTEETLVKLSSAVEQIVDTIAITDRNGLIEYVNPAFETLTGYSANEAIGKTPRIIKSDDKDLKYYEGMWKTILSGLVFRGEFVNKKKNGDLYYEEKTISPIFDKNKNITHFVGTGVDITDRKKAELIIQKQYSQLKDLNAAKDKFFSIIAHDLKSPFSGLMNLTEIMATESKDFTISEFAELSKALNDSAVNLFKLLENLLEWASIQQGLMSFDLKVLNLFSVVSDNILTVADRAAQKGISIINQVKESINISADERMINTVFRNLLSNAVKFTKKDGTIRVSTKSIENGMIEVSVSDTGVGIVKKDLERLFKIGEKVGTMGTDNELSTGLGLLLCQEFIDKHGGRIWVESEEKKGSTFYFTLTGSNTKCLINSAAI